MTNFTPLNLWLEKNQLFLSVAPLCFSILFRLLLLFTVCRSARVCVCSWESVCLWELCFHHSFFLSVIVVVVVLCLLFSFFLLFVLFLNIILYCILCNIYHLRQLILTFMKRRHGRTGPAAGTRGSRICDAKKRCLPVRLFAFFVCLFDVTLCALVLLLVFMRFFSPVHPTAGSSPALIYIRFTFQHMCVCVCVFFVLLSLCLIFYYYSCLISFVCVFVSLSFRVCFVV